MANGIPMGLHRTVFCALALYHFISRRVSLYEAGLPRDDRLGKSVVSCLVCRNVCVVFRGSLQPVHAMLPPEDKRSTGQRERDVCGETARGIDIHTWPVSDVAGAAGLHPELLGNSGCKTEQHPTMKLHEIIDY